MNIGDTYSWKPCAYEAMGHEQDQRSGRARGMVHGRIVYINEKHRYFTVEAEVHGYRLRESFKF